MGFPKEGHVVGPEFEGTRIQVSHNRTFIRRLHLDLPLLSGLALLSAVGLIVLYSAGGENSNLVIRQGVRLAIAFGAMFLIAQISPQHLFRWTPWFYLGGLGLLIAVPYFGDVAQGAQRWLSIGGFRFQPSEFSKLTVPMMVAFYLSGRPLPPDLGRLLVVTLIIATPTLLIARQPDLGTSLLVAGAGVFVLFLSGVRWRIVCFVGILTAATAPIMWYLLHDYQRQRVMTLLDPGQDPLGTGYHIIQSKVAIGSGGLYGKGWLNGTQSQLEFLPERSTDFVFAVFSEEFGFLGVVLLLIAYLFVVVRGLQLAVETQETFGRLLGGALVLTFFVYIVINIGMACGLLPVVGLPLPLISYGGTSLVSIMVAFGILMSVHNHRRLLSD